MLVDITKIPSIIKKYYENLHFIRMKIKEIDKFLDASDIQNLDQENIRRSKINKNL